MLYERSFRFAAVTLAVIGSLLMNVGCESLPGDEKTQGAVIGGLAGAGAGALIGGEDNRLLGALIGGALGAGGGYLVGANWDKITGDEKDEAERAVRRAEQDPATADEARRALTADVNRDGFVTKDEIIAMERADLSDKEMIRRLRATDQYFELTTSQERDLIDAGVSEDVIIAMREMAPEDATPEAKREILSRRSLNGGRDAAAGVND